MSTKLVFDTSALISLSLAETLYLVDKLGFEVIIPPAVLSELGEASVYNDDVATSARRALSFVKECMLGLNERSRELADRLSKMPKLDRGEAEALALAQQVEAEHLVIDDIDAMGALLGVAEIIGVEIVPSSWLIVKSYLEGLLEYDQAVGVLDALAVARGWKQSVIYGTAILMMEKAREVKGEK